MARGFHAAGDVLVTQTADGVSLNDLWDDYQAALNIWNGQRTTLLNFLTYRTTLLTEQLYQGGELTDFEVATEYGVPVAARPGITGSFIGYDFEWFDIAGRFTWKFLNKAPAAQVNAFANQVFEADNRKMFTEIMRTLFANSRRTAEEGHLVYPFYAGVAGDLPVPYKATTFADSHNHYITTGGVLAPADFEAQTQLLAEHGYTRSNGYNIVAMVALAEANVIRGWRSVQNGGTGLFDFIPAQNTPSFLLPVNLTTNGSQPAQTIAGLNVLGSYGDVTIVQEDYVPAGWIPMFATGGPDSLTNPVGIREDPNANLRGLKLVKGRDADYPLMDSYYVRGFGTGIRQRGAGAVMQVTANPTYTAPTNFG